MANGTCESYIESNQDYSSSSLPEGYHVVGERRCPRNLSSKQSKKAVPDGVNPCPLFHNRKCSGAFAEELHCPTRRGRRNRNNPLE